MYKACIFDLDGTLADTVESIAKSANEALAAVGLPEQPVEKYNCFAGDGAKILLQRALISAGDSELEHFEEVDRLYRDFFKEGCTYHVKPYEGIRSMLGFLKEAGIKIAVLSNKPHDRAVQVVETLFGKAYFDLILGQQPGLEKKPSPEGALSIASCFGVETGECLYIGDTNTDMQTGNNAGMCTVGVTWGFRDRKELEENNAHVIIDKPMELLRLIL
jgi:phosphoglycolate phosphatase